MPINQTSYERYATFLVDAMDGAQVKLVRLSDATLVNLAKNPGATIAASQQMHGGATKIAAEYGKQSKAWADKVLPKAYREGILDADHDLKALGKWNKPDGLASLDSPALPASRLTAGIAFGVPEGFEKFPAHLAMVNVFQHNAAEAGVNASLQIIRGADDAARKMAQLAGSQLFKESSTFTRRALSKEMVDGLAKKGIGFVQYANGRKMPLDSYAEMVGRTMSGRAALVGNLGRYKEQGFDLVLVTAHFRTCEMCAPWEGRVLSQDGKSSKHPPLQVAIDSGLFHPNCAHDVTPYFEKLTRTRQRATRVKKHPMEQKLVDAHGRAKAQELTFRAQQRQRQIERNIRSWKRRASVDGKQGLAARKKVRQWQAKMREHRFEHPYLPRKYAREAITPLGPGVLTPGGATQPLGAVVKPKLPPVPKPKPKPVAKPKPPPPPPSKPKPGPAPGFAIDLAPIKPARPLGADQVLFNTLPKNKAGQALPSFKTKQVPEINSPGVLDAAPHKKAWFPLSKARSLLEEAGDVEALNGNILKKLLKAGQEFKSEAGKISVIKRDGLYTVIGGMEQVQAAKLLGRKFVTAGEVIDLDALAKQIKKQAAKVKKPAFVEKPAAVSKAKEVVAAQPKKVLTLEVKEGSDLSGWKKVGEKKGSNVGGVYENPKTGEKWYVKTPADAEIARNEVLSAKLYRLAGVEVPDVELVTLNGKTSVASRIVDNLKSNPGMLQSGSASGITEGFAVDAWLANWDVIGMSYDNMLVRKVGGKFKALRLDTGGSLRYRAQGSLKGTQFGDVIEEFKSLRSSINPQSESVFGSMTNNEIAASIEKLKALKKVDIDKLVDRYGPTYVNGKTELKARLWARRNDALKQQKKFLTADKRAAQAAAKAERERIAAEIRMRKEIKNLAKPVKDFEKEVDKWNDLYEKAVGVSAKGVEGAAGLPAKGMNQAMAAAKKALEQRHGWLASRGDTFVRDIMDDVVSHWSGSAQTSKPLAMKHALKRAWGEKVNSVYTGRSVKKGAKAVREWESHIASKLGAEWNIPKADFWKFMEDAVKAKQGYTRWYLGKEAESFTLYRAHGMSGDAQQILATLASGNKKMYVPNGASGFSSKKLFFGSGEMHVTWKVRAAKKNIWGTWKENLTSKRWRYGQRESEWVVTGNTMVDVLPGTELSIGSLKIPGVSGFKQVSNFLAQGRSQVPVTAKHVLDLMKKHAPDMYANIKKLAEAGWKVTAGSGSVRLSDAILAAAA